MLGQKTRRRRLGEGRKRGYEFTMALCNSPTPAAARFSPTVTLLYPPLFFSRFKSCRETRSFSPGYPSPSFYIYIYIDTHIYPPFFSLFPRLSGFIHFTVLAVNAINGFRFRCLNLAFSALCLQAARLFLPAPVLQSSLPSSHPPPSPFLRCFSR